MVPEPLVPEPFYPEPQPTYKAKKTQCKLLAHPYTENSKCRATDQPKRHRKAQKGQIEACKLIDGEVWITIMVSPAVQ